VSVMDSTKNSLPEYHYNGSTIKDIYGCSRTKHRSILRLVKLVDVLTVGVPFVFAWLIYYVPQMRDPYYKMGNFLMITLYYILYYLTAHLYSGFLIQIKRISEIIYSQLLAVIITNFMIYIVMWLLLAHLPNILVLLVMLAVQVCIIILWARWSHKWYFRRYPAMPSIIIYDEMAGMEKLIHQYGMEAHFKINGVYSINDILNDEVTGNDKETEQKQIRKIIGDAHVVFLCGLHSHDRNQIVKYCAAYDVVAYVLPRIGDVIMSGAVRMPLFHEPMLRVGRYNPSPEYLFFKRFFDILFSSLGLVILSPLMIVLAIIIRSDGGTAFYRQKRLTKNGKVFEVLKFRSMRMDAEKDGVARLSTGEKDPRITKIGRFIRSCRMDELPQLINILKGDMSIVGPRPERPEIAAQYKEELPEFDLRLQCKCGLTGYAQVYGQYNTTPYDKLLMDLMYISKPSLAEDFKICLATIKILFMKDSTEGVAEGQTTASAGSIVNTEVSGDRTVEK
jgi:exopolysaccharide biosynthesis polyprenyl glycosylphosphotransferase